MNKIKVALLSLLISAGSAMAQKAKVDNVLNLRSAKSSGEIMEKNKLVGYFVFFTKEKVDKKNTAYEIQTFDNNYNPAKKFEIIRSKNAYLIEMAYNANAFMLHFYDKKTGYEFVTFDRSGKQTGSHIVGPKMISSLDLQRVSQNISAKTDVIDIYPLGDKGFVRNTYAKNKKTGYELTAFDNNAKVLWTLSSDVKSKMLEMLEIADVSESIIAGTLMKKKSAFTKEMDTYALLINPKTGKLIKEIPLGNEQEGVRSLMKAFINTTNQNLTIVGEFYKPKDDIAKDRSQGLYLQEFSLTGQEISMTKYKWKGDIDKFKMSALEEDDKKNDNRPFYIYFHDVVITDQGNIFLVGEQFIKQVSAGGLALNALAAASGGSSNASAFEIMIANMIVIEFDKSKKLKDFDVIPKKKTKVILAQGYGLVNSTTLGFLMKSSGHFDYAFTLRDEKNNNFDIVYVDANRKEEKGSKNSDLMVGVISFRDNKKATARVPINTQSNYWWIQAAKPGFIAIGEYSRKEKQIDFRLEPIAY